jgi:hypothetical protein
MRQIAAIIATLLALSTTATWGTENLCEQVRSWPVPRRLFANPDQGKSDQQLLRAEKGKRISVLPDDQHRPSDGGGYFAAEPGNRLRLSTGRDEDVILSVPEFAHRPLAARWINPKLLYLEIWFNPHDGAYWIYDAESEKVLIHELQNDGTDAWQQCHSSQKSEPSK